MNEKTSSELLQEYAPVEYRIRPGMEALLVILCVLLATFSTIYFIYERALEAQKGEIRQGLMRTARVISTLIDPEVHKSFQDPEEEFSQPYIDAEDILLRVRRSDPKIAFVYTAIKRDGKVLFVLDPTPPPEEGEEDTRVALFEEYLQPPDELMRVLRDQEIVASEEPYTDEWGSFVSAFVPLFDAQGEMFGVLGVDIDATDYFERLAPIRRATVRALVTAFFVAFLMGSAVWFLRNFIRVLNQRRMVIYAELAYRLAVEQQEADEARAQLQQGQTT